MLPHIAYMDPMGHDITVILRSLLFPIFEWICGNPQVFDGNPHVIWPHFPSIGANDSDHTVTEAWNHGWIAGNRPQTALFQLIDV